MKKLITTVCAVLILIMTSAAVHADYDVSVRMDSVTADNSSQYVQFGDAKPLSLDNRIYVPARTMAEAAGMDVVWDQSTQTAILLLKIGLYSEKPIERYAAKAISMVNPPTPGLSPVDITATIKLDSSTAVIRYNFRDSEGDYVAVGREYEMTSKATVVNDGTIMLPLRDSMEIFGLIVGWNQDEMCAFVSVPETVTLPDDLGIIALNGTGKYAPPQDLTNSGTSYAYEDNGGGTVSYENTAVDPQSYENTGKYLGKFYITHYCPCEICNEGWGDNTAWAGKIVPGRTIGVNPDIIPPLSWVYIEGYGLRRAEDTGGGIGTYHIDIAVESHDLISTLETSYRDVYLVE